MKQQYTVTGMTCGHCLKSVREALAPFAAKVEVTLDPPHATIEGEAEVPLEQLNRALSAAGRYRLEPLA